MAAHVSTINKARSGTASSLARPLLWSSFDSGANNVTFNVAHTDASKMVVLVAAHSTLTNRWYIGTSDSRSSHTSMSYPYSAKGLGRMLIKTTVVTDGNAISKFKSTLATAGAGDTEVLAIYALGPFETARFKDSNDEINICRAITTADGASHSSDEQHICAILLP